MTPAEKTILIKMLAMIHALAIPDQYQSLPLDRLKNIQTDCDALAKELENL
jgi:hypothetical protein